ncbi:MAG: M56 family metallopeptidase [Candidatus Baltobacteraceae bacterium]
MILAILSNGLWQGALIVLVTYAITKMTSANNASTRCALWLAALLALVVVPIATTASDAGARLLQLLHERSAQSAYTIELLPVGMYAQHTLGWVERAATWIVLGWLIGVGVNLVRLGASFVRVEGIRLRARRLAPGQRDVYLSEDVAVPIVAGIVAPKIVVPCDLPERLSAAELHQVVAHERAHVLRNDPLWNLLQRLIEAALFFNPWVRIAAAALSNEREAACDDWVVEKTGSPDDYAVCLATLAHMIRKQDLPLLTAGAYRSRHGLVTRIKRLHSGGPRRLNVNAYALGGTIVLFLVATLALQALSPALALTPPAQAGLPAYAHTSSEVAGACVHPNADASVVNAAAPSLPHGLKAEGTVNVAVTIAPNGHVIGTKVLRSSGNASIDEAVVEAARNSTYSPKLAGCTPIEGQYVFHVEFAPSS